MCMLLLTVAVLRRPLPGAQPTSANAILTMDGTPDNKGESMLAIASLFQGVSIFNVDSNMQLLGTLPQVGACGLPGMQVWG